MKHVHAILLKNECIKFAANEGLKIHVLDHETFIAEDSEVIIHVPLNHLYDQLQQGHSVQDTLRNETGHKGDS